MFSWRTFHITMIVTAKKVVTRDIETIMMGANAGPDRESDSNAICRSPEITLAPGYSSARPNSNSLILSMTWVGLR